MDTQAPSTSSPQPVRSTANPHVLWRQLLGFVLWVGLFSFVAGGPIGAAFCLVLGGATFVDAWKSGIYKRRETKSFLNISPMSWGIAMALLFIVAYPTYLLNRNKLRTIDGTKIYYWATVVVGAIALILFILNVLGTIALRAK